MTDPEFTLATVKSIYNIDWLVFNANQSYKQASIDYNHFVNQL